MASGSKSAAGKSPKKQPSKVAKADVIEVDDVEEVTSNVSISLLCSISPTTCSRVLSPNTHLASCLIDE